MLFRSISPNKKLGAKNEIGRAGNATGMASTSPIWARSHWANLWNWRASLSISFERFAEPMIAFRAPLFLVYRDRLIDLELFCNLNLNIYVPDLKLELEPEPEPELGLF